MSEASVTERDAVLRERAAFRAAVEAVYEGCVDHADARDHIRSAERRYPLPKVRRARVVRDHASGHEWTVAREGALPDGRNGYICGRIIGETVWRTSGNWVVTQRRLQLWADLLANPTELVDDE